MDHDKLQIQGLEQNQLCTWLARLFSAAGGEPSSKRYFKDKPLMAEACSDASDADNRDPWDLPHIMMITFSSESELACFEFSFVPVA